MLLYGATTQNTAIIMILFIYDDMFTNSLYIHVDQFCVIYRSGIAQ
jgi:hypothetical protein